MIERDPGIPLSEWTTKLGPLQLRHGCYFHGTLPVVSERALAEAMELETSESAPQVIMLHAGTSRPAGETFVVVRTSQNGRLRWKPAGGGKWRAWCDPAPLLRCAIRYDIGVAVEFYAWVVVVDDAE